MKMLTIAALASAALAATATATAQTLTTVTFATVDSLETDAHLYLPSMGEVVGGKVVGVPEGQPAPQTYGYFFGSSSTEISALRADRCERLIMMTLNRPGRYNLVMTSDSPNAMHNNVLYLNSPICKLVRR